MKLWAYLKYFFYIAANWNLRLAMFLFYHEVRGERKYGVHTTGWISLREFDLKEEDIVNGEEYQGAGYYQLEKVFDFLKKEKAIGGIVDLGSGKGRVLAVAAEYGFKHIVGVELVAELCNAAEKNLKLVRKKHPQTDIRVVNQNVLQYTIDPEINVFFFFNPFNQVVMRKVVEAILRSLITHPRKVYVAYINPQHEELFLAAGFKQLFHLQKMKYIHASVLCKTP